MLVLRPDLRAETGAQFVKSDGMKLHCVGTLCSTTPPPPPDPRYWPARPCAYKKGHEWDPQYAGCLPDAFWDLPPAVLAQKKAKGELTHLVIRDYTEKDEAFQRKHADATMAAAFALWDQLPRPTSAAEAEAQHAQVLALWQQTGAAMPEALKALYGDDEKARTAYNRYARDHGLPEIQLTTWQRISSWVGKTIPGGWWTVGGTAAALTTLALLLPPRRPAP